MHSKNICIALTLLFGASDFLEAQELREGDRIRVLQQQPGKPREDAPRSGTLMRVATDTLWVSFIRQEPPTAVPLETVQRLELWTRGSRSRSALKWTWQGALIGAAAGSVFCMADQTSCQENLGADNLAEAVFSFARFYGVIGAVTGAAGGALFPARAWRPVEPPYTRIGGERQLR